MPPKRKTTSAKETGVKRSKPTEKSSSNGGDVDPPAEAAGKTMNDSAVPLAPNGQAFNTKLVSWNVNGVRAVLKNKGMDYLIGEPCDVLCLQEVKCSQSTFPSELKTWKEFPHKYYALSDQDGYAGVAIFSKVEPSQVDYGLGNSEHDAEGRVITAHFDKFILVNAYVPNAGRGLKRLDYRMKWDQDFLAHLSKLDAIKPVVLCGDLNVSHQEIDLENPKTNHKTAGFTPQERDNFTRLLSSGFIDSYRNLYPEQTKAYTFWSYMRAARAKNIGWRLDYFVLSTRLGDNVCDHQLRQHVMGSDHCPVILYLAL